MGSVGLRALGSSFTVSMVLVLGLRGSGVRV